MVRAPAFINARKRGATLAAWSCRVASPRPFVPPRRASQSLDRAGRHQVLHRKPLWLLPEGGAIGDGRGPWPSAGQQP